jgi:serine protease Do
VARHFVLVRLPRIEDVDLHLFDFDFDLTWAGFFLNADERIYGRYGSRDASGPDGRQSLNGLRYALQSAWEAHQRLPATPDDVPPRERLRILDFPAGPLAAAQSCIHCHQVNEIRRAALQKNGQWNRDDVWVYPLPENIGLVLDVDRGDRVQSVVPASPASRVGLAAGDLLETIDDVPIASIADVKHGLHRAPSEGELRVNWRRGTERLSGKLLLAEGWRKTNITWRPSVLELLPATGLWGSDLTEDEKLALGLAANRLAFRQHARVHANAQAAGVQAGDIILGINGQLLEMTMFGFLGYIRQNYLIGDQVTLNVLRDGRRVDLPTTLK